MRRRRCPPWVDEELKLLRERLAAYLERERVMLDSTGGVKSYMIGPRSATRYDTSLKDVQDAIENLRRRIAELEAIKCGRSPRRALGAVPRDDW